MASWGEFEAAEPEFASRVRQLFDAGRHKTIATVRSDGSPRISGIECAFDDGELRFGSMPRSRKLADLFRDPRVAIHGPTFHPEEGREGEWPGEAKVAGCAFVLDATSQSDDAEIEGAIFRVDLSEVVITRLDDKATKLVVESWTPERGLRLTERD